MGGDRLLEGHLIQVDFSENHNVYVVIRLETSAAMWNVANDLSF